ncbi:MAG: malonyl-ACP O-methyltransferase BioC [Legionellales bacterium]|nr:malonyl-ACP O-methyltransferase BioC [Legionellales bacterium]
MQLEIPEVVKKFSRNPAEYHKNAVFQKEICTRLLSRLQYCSLSPDLILDLGCGTGFVTTDIKGLYPRSSIFSLDISLEMTRFARKQINNRMICADATILPFPSNSFDLIIANLLLHWVNDFESLLLECQRILSEDGLLLFSTLSNNSLLELKESWSNIDNYDHVHKYFDFIDLGNYLLKTFWKDPVIDQEQLVVAYPAFCELVKDLKNTGLANSACDRFKGLYTKNKLLELEKFYSKYIDDNGKFPVTYEIIYGHCLKGKANSY